MWLLGVLRYAAGLALLVAAVAKARAVPAFGASLAAYGIRPPWDRPVALAVIGLEAVTAVVAYTPIGDRPTGVLVAALGVVFLAAQVYILSVGNQTPCLCFGAANAEPPSARTLARAALVLLAGVLLLAGTTTARPVDAVAVLAAPVLLALIAVAVRMIPVATPSPYRS